MQLVWINNADSNESTLKVSILGQIRACCVEHIGRCNDVFRILMQAMRPFELVADRPSIPRVLLLMHLVEFIGEGLMHIYLVLLAKPPWHRKEVAE